MGSFLEDFILGETNDTTGEVSGGIGGAAQSFSETPFAQFWGEVLDNPIISVPVNAATSTIMAGLNSVEFLESYVLARPTSTILQAISADNPLYKNGLQVDDFVQMWNASEYISPGRAGVTFIGDWYAKDEMQRRGGQPLPPGTPTWNEFSYAMGYDPYTMTPEELEKKWDSSNFGTIGSVSLDTAFVIGAGGKGVNAAARGMKRAAGLSTTIKSQKDLTRLRAQGELGILWKESGGTIGRETPFHRLIAEVAGTSDYATIRSSPLINNWTRSGSFNADELAQQWTKIDDERLIMDMALADRGDVQAIGRLFREAPDTAWSLMDMTEVMRRQFAEGGQFVPDANTARIYNQTFESAVERDEFWRSVKNTFMVTDPNATRVTAQPGMTISMQQGQETGGLISGIRMAGSDTMPMGSTGVRGVSDVVGYAENWVKRTIANARINRPNSWNEIQLGSGAGRAPVTRLLFWAGSRRPNNMIEFNSMRPDEIVDEMVAYSRSSRALRQKQWTVTRKDADGIPDNITMRDYEWRAEALSRLAAAKSQGDQPLAAVVRELEEELISVVANKYRVGPDEAARIASGLRNKSDSYQAQVARDGFYFDDGVQVVVDPATKRQLANSMVLMPLDDLDWAIREGSATSFARRGRATQKYAVQPTKAVLDTVYRFFRTNVLFRPGYIPKNSLGEPAVAALLADASLLPEGGVTRVVGRMSVNNYRRGKQFIYNIQDRLPASAAKRDARKLDALRDEYDLAVRQLEEIELRIDDLNAASPATRAKFANAAAAERRSAYAQLKDIERRLDVNDPVWRDVEELPSYNQLKDRVQLIDDAFNGPDFVVTAQSRINNIYVGAAGGDATLRRTLSEVDDEITRLQQKADELRKLRNEQFGEDFASQRVGKRKDLVDDEVILKETDDYAVSAEMPGRRAPSWIEQLERLNDPRNMDRLRREVPDAAARRRIEATVRSLMYVEDQILAAQAKARKAILDAQKAGRTRSLNPVEAAEVAHLERLIGLRSRTLAGEVDGRGVLDDLRAQLEDIRETTFRVETSAANKKKTLEQRLVELDGERRSVMESIAARNLAREKVRKRKLSGEEDIDVAGYNVPGIFSEEPGQFGAALRVDSSANMTAYQTASGGARSGMRWKQSSSGETINPFDPRYYDELAYVANRHVRGDDYATLFLQGKTQGEIIAWLKSPAGREYRKAMGWKQADIYGENSVIVRTQNMIDQYFPTKEVKNRILTGDDVTAAELQSLMGKLSIDELSPIYGTGLEFVGNPLARVSRWLDNASDAAWRNLAAKPESRFGRWPFMQREYRRQMERQIRLAEEQGLTLTGSTLQSMARTSRSRALKEMENTFYNIRRMAGPIYAMRYFMGFPAAAYNTAYRYGRLAYRSPGNAFVQANAWTSALEYLGVDEEGNKVDDWEKVDNLIFSVPEEWNLPIDPKIQVKAESIYLGAQEGSFLPTITMPVSTLMRYKPELNVWMQEEAPDLYETMFGYGAGTDPDFSIGPIPVDPFMASYQRKGIRFAQSFFTEIPDEDFMRVAIQDWQYRMYEWDKNGQVGPRPDWEDSAKNARDQYGIGTLVSWLAFGSFRISPEGQFYRDEWFRIREKHPNDFPAAQREMIDMYGPGAFFLMRPTSKNRSGMPATAEGLELFQNNPELLKASREINPQDPSLVSNLMFLDARAYSDGEFNEAIYDWMANNSLPGETEPLLRRLTPDEINDELAIQESWSIYSAAAAKRDALMLQYGYKQLRPDGDSDWLYKQWSEWYEGFTSNPDNRLWVAERDSWDRGKTDRAIAGIDEFLGNKKWMSGPGTSITWQTIKDYRFELDNARNTYEYYNTVEGLSPTERSDAKRQVAEEWDAYVRYWFLPVAGNFSDYYDRYLSGRDITGQQLLDREFDIPRYPIEIGASGG